MLTAVSLLSIGLAVALDQNEMFLLQKIISEKTVSAVIMQNKNSSETFKLQKFLSENKILSSGYSDEEIKGLSDVSKIYPPLSFWEGTKNLGGGKIAGGRILLLIDVNLLSEMYRPLLEIETSAMLNSAASHYLKSYFLYVTFINHPLEDKRITAAVPYNTESLAIYSTNDGLEIFSNYFAKEKSFSTLWGKWNDGQRELWQANYPRLLSGIQLKRQFYPLEIYPDYKKILVGHHEVMDGIAEILNFSYILMDMMDKNFFDEDTSDSITLMHAYSWLSGTVGPVIKLKMNFFIKSLGNNQLSNYFIYPFEYTLWLIIGLWMLVAASFIGLLHYLADEKQVIPDNVASVFEAFCYQGGSWIDGPPHSRIARASVLLTVAVVIPAYSAVIFAFMTVRHMQLPFDDIHGMAEHGRYRLGLQRGSFPLYLLQTDPTVGQDVAKVLLPAPELPYTMSEAADMICAGINQYYYAFIGYNELIRQIPNKCDITKLTNPVHTLLVAVPLRPFSPYSRPFTQLMAKFWENGMVNRFQGDFDAPIPQNTQTAVDPVEVTFIAEVYYFLAAGVALSVLFFTLEIVTARLFKKKE